MKNRNSIMPEDYEEFVSLTLRTRNSKKPFMLVDVSKSFPLYEPKEFRTARPNVWYRLTVGVY